MKLTILSLILLINSIAASAEEYSISLQGSELKKVSALELKLAFDPPNAFALEENFLISSISNQLPSSVIVNENIDSTILDDKNDLLFRTIDVNNSLIRIFLAKPLQNDELVIDGNLKRINYSGDAKVSIANINYIPDFSKEIDPNKIKSRISVITNEDPLPFRGISKAEILGPHERIFAEDMFVSIGKIETYGFTCCDKSVKEPKINGVEAKFLNNEIIAANLKLNPEKLEEELEIMLELNVDNELITKKVGTIKLLEAVK